MLDTSFYKRKLSYTNQICLCLIKYFKVTHNNKEPFNFILKYRESMHIYQLYMRNVSYALDNAFIL